MIFQRKAEAKEGAGRCRKGKMDLGGRWAFFTGCLVVLFIFYSHPARATYLRGEITDIYRHFDFDTADEDRDRFRPLTNYLNLDLYKVKDKELNFLSSWRKFNELSRSENDTDLLYAYLEWKNLTPNMDLQLGRQYSIEGLGFYSFDGLDLSLHHLGPPLIFNFFSGLPVREGFPIEEREPRGRSGDYVIGGRVALSGHPWTDAALSYERQLFEHDLAEEKIGIELRHRFWTRNWTYLEIYGNTDYNIALDQFDEAMFGIARYLSWWGHRGALKLEYFHYKPNFQTESIFNVFNIGPYNDVRGRFTFEISDGLELYGHYTIRFFPNTGNKDDDEKTIGLGVNYTFPGLGDWTLDFWQSDGYQELQRSVELRGARDFLGGRLNINGGFNLTYFELISMGRGERRPLFQRPIVPEGRGHLRRGDRDYSPAIWLESIYKFSDWASLSFEVMESQNDFASSQFTFYAEFKLSLEAGSGY